MGITHGILWFAKKKYPTFSPKLLPKLGLTVGTGLLSSLFFLNRVLAKYLDEIATWDASKSPLAEKFQLILSDYYGWQRNPTEQELEQERQLQKEFQEKRELMQSNQQTVTYKDVLQSQLKELERSKE